MTGRTVGVEEELLLVSAETGRATAVAGALLGAAETSETSESRDGMLEAELQQQQIEIGTRPCLTLTELAQQLRQWRSRTDALARAAGARLAALATSPLVVEPLTTRQPRYQRMVEHFGLTTVEQLTCGCHVHVEVTSPEEGVAVLDRIRPWLPVLLALSANSPYWQGTDTGYASFRSQAWTRFPSAGPSEVFGSAAAYEERVAAMVASGVLLDRHMVYFDARLSDSYPTVEIRVADICLDPDDTVVVAGLVRGLVDTAVRDWSAGSPPPTMPADLLRLATWRAGRSGLTGDLLDPVTGRPRPAEDVVDRLLSQVDRALVDGGDADVVRDGVQAILARGTGAQFQREVFARTGSLREVVLAAAARSVT